MSSINPAATLGPVAEGLAPISFNPVLTTKNKRKNKMRQTGRTTRIVQHVVEQLYSVGKCVATDHVVYEFGNPRKSMLDNFKEKVEREVEFKSFGAKKVKALYVEVDGVPYIKFELISIE